MQKYFYQIWAYSTFTSVILALLSPVSGSWIIWVLSGSGGPKRDPTGIPPCDIGLGMGRYQAKIPYTAQGTRWTHLQTNILTLFWGKNQRKIFFKEISVYPFECWWCRRQRWRCLILKKHKLKLSILVCIPIMIMITITIAITTAIAIAIAIYLFLWQFSHPSPPFSAS